MEKTSEIQPKEYDAVETFNKFCIFIASVDQKEIEPIIERYNPHFKFIVKFLHCHGDYSIELLNEAEILYDKYPHELSMLRGYEQYMMGIGHLP